MNATVIDTLRFSNRLKEAGVEARQAEAMSRAFNDELSEGVATKRDLDNAVTELKGEIATKFAKVDGRLDAMDAKFEGKFLAVDARFDVVDSKFDAMDSKFDVMDSKFDAMDAKFDAMDAKFEALTGKFGTQSRYVFLVLALVVTLGLYNAAAPHFLGKQSATVVTATPVRSS